MRPYLLAGLVVLSVTPALAAGPSLKAGLWEMKTINQTMDGKDQSAAVGAGYARMQESLANLPPEQRARVEAMMKQRGGPTFGADGTIRMCISPEMAARDRPIVDREGRCQPATVTTSGNEMQFEVNCSSNGVTTVGKGHRSTSADGVIHTTIDMTTRKDNGETHVMHNESEMHFVGADCGDVKPVQPSKSTP